MRFKFILLLAIFSKVCTGQIYQTQESKLCFEIAPLAYINPIYATPSYELGSEIKLHSTISLYIEGGGYFSLNGHDWLTRVYSGSQMSEVKGYCVKAEVKCYLNPSHLASGNYISIEGLYKKQEFNWQDSIHLTPAYVTTFRDSKSVYCFTVKYGYTYLFGGKFVVDLYCGLGVRVRSVTSTLTPQEVGALQYNDDNSYDSPGDSFMTNPNGHSIFPNIEGGVKIGYVVK